MIFFGRETVYTPGRKIGGYTVEKVSGEGRYGICYLVSNDDGHYILKQLKRSMLKKAKTKAGCEPLILSSLNHESLPRFIGKVETEGLYGYVLEYKEGDTFEDLIYSKGHIFPESEIHSIGLQLVGILKYLHRLEIVHRDISVPNALYSDRRVYLVDFGLARRVDNMRYRPDVDFAYLGDFLLHLYYTSYEAKGKKKKPWHEELNLPMQEIVFLKRLLGIEEKYQDIDEVERDLVALIGNQQGQAC